jgi:arylsulfatase A
MRRVTIALLLALLTACATPRDTETEPQKSTPVDLREIACPAAPATRPNIVLVFADDLGYGELGCYGQAKIATPNIDRLAREGLRFTQFYTAAPVCAPARSALLTGQHLGHTPIRDNSEVQPEGQGPLPEGTRTLAHDLRDAGYATACVGKWGLGFVGSSGDPNAAGFDLFFGYNCQRQAWSYYPTHLWRNQLKVVLDGNEPSWKAPAERTESIHACDLLLTEAKDFIAGCAAAPEARPFLLAYHSPLPHLALQPPPANLRRYQGLFDETPYVGGKGYLPHESPRAAYAAMITRLDDEVGEIRAALERGGIADRTIVIVASDNGATHDVGGVDTQYFDSCAGLRGRKGSVFEGGIRVPGIAWWPGQIAAGSVTEVPAWTVDLRATFNALAGKHAPATDGVDLSGLLLRGEAPTARAMYWPFPGYGGQEALREGDWKIVRRELAKAAKDNQPVPAWQLYDLARDPKETTDLAAQHPEVVARLAALADREFAPSERFPLARSRGE